MIDSSLVEHIYQELHESIPTLLGMLARLQAAEYLKAGELGEYLETNGEYTRDDLIGFLWLILIVEGYEK